MPIMAHHADVHCENLQCRLNPACRTSILTLQLARHCECGDTGRRRIGRQAEGSPAPNGHGDAVRNPAQVSFWPLEPAVDAANDILLRATLCHGRRNTAIFPAAMDVQLRMCSYGCAATDVQLWMCSVGVSCRDRQGAAGAWCSEPSHPLRPGPRTSGTSQAALARRARLTSGTCRRTQRCAARRPRPPPCRTSAGPARSAAPSEPAWGS